MIRAARAILIPGPELVGGADLRLDPMLGDDDPGIQSAGPIRPAGKICGRSR